MSSHFPTPGFPNIIVLNIFCPTNLELEEVSSGWPRLNISLVYLDMISGKSFIFLASVCPRVKWVVTGSLRRKCLEVKRDTIRTGLTQTKGLREPPPPRLPICK